MTLKQPDMVPTFELEFQLEKEMFGTDTLYAETIQWEEFKKLTPKEVDYLIEQYAEAAVNIYCNQLDYFSIPIRWQFLFTEENQIKAIKAIRKLVGNNYMIHAHGDGTLGLPDGNSMVEFSYQIADDPESIHQEARRKADEAIERNHKYIDAGSDLLILCADYCYNSGPYLSPQMFGEFIAPYLTDILANAKRDGAYTIKHTDGNIMPILDQLVATQPNAIHSLDPMAGVDIAEVKRLVGDKVCLCGNVNCSAIQIGTSEQIIKSAEYAMNSGKPNGGYIYCTSNVPFKGITAQSYQLVLDVWKRMRKY